MCGTWIFSSASVDAEAFTTVFLTGFFDDDDPLPLITGVLFLGVPTPTLCPTDLADGALRCPTFDMAQSSLNDHLPHSLYGLMLLCGTCYQYLPLQPHLSLDSLFDEYIM